MLSERNQSPKIIYCMIPILQSVQKRKSTEAESILVLPRAGKIGEECRGIEC